MGQSGIFKDVLSAKLMDKVIFTQKSTGGAEMLCLDTCREHTGGRGE